MFEGFDRRRIQTAGAEINLVTAGSGPPLLLLHGAPQTHVMWHRIAPALAERFTVVATDLRGYGDSSKPRGEPDHGNYSFRAMAQDQVDVMSALAFERFMVAGHDRGARTTHRMALDHAERVEKAAILDILPTLTMYEETDRDFATAYWHWFFLIQPYDMPERFIEGGKGAYVHEGLWPLVERGAISPEAWSAYERSSLDPAAIHGLCEDYRAAATIDLEHDRADREQGRRIECPVLVLWGNRNPVWSRFDMLEVWRRHARHVSGGSLDCGHFLPEESPDETLARLLAFFGG
jgi:haloacetate dehalogenase